MWNLHEGMHLLFEAANRYLEGESSVHELNGIASSCLQLGKVCKTQFRMPNGSRNELEAQRCAQATRL
jgi:hypothetical protein